MIVSHINLVKDGKEIGSLKDNKMTRVPVKKKPTQSAVSADEAEKIKEEITQLTKQWSIVHTPKIGIS